MSTLPQDLHICAFEPETSCGFFVFHSFLTFKILFFYSYSVGHDFHDNLQDMFRRKMTSGGAVDYGNSPS